MKKLSQKLLAGALVSAMAVFSFASCVNEEYDLSEGVDMDMQLLQNATIPLGNTGGIGIDALFGGTESSFLNTNENGDLSLTLVQDRMTQSFKMPNVSLSGENGFNVKSATLNFSFPTRYSANDIIYLKSNGKDGMNIKTTVQIEKELPESVLSIRSITMDKGTLKYIFSASEGSVMNIESGFVIDFPDYMILTPKSTDAPYEVVNGNKVIFTKDAKVSDSTPLILDMNFSALSGLENYIVEKRNSANKLKRFISTSEYIQVYGNVYVDPSDYRTGYLQKSHKLMMDVDTKNLDMTSSEVMLNMDLTIPDNVMEFSQMPNMFTGEGTVVDLYNPTLKLAIDNESPLQMNLNAEVTARCGDHTTDMHIGDNCKYGNHETRSVLIPPTEHVEYYFSRQGHHNSNVGEDITLEALGDIIKEMPNEFSIHDILVKSERKYITVKAGQEYHVDIDYEFTSDLSFGKDLSIAFEYDIDLGLNTSLSGMNSLVLSMNLLNSIPLDLAIKGYAVDANGNELSSSPVDIKIAAGDLSNQVSTPAEIELCSDDSETNISKLRLKITASCNESAQGKVLNISQGLSINDLSVKLPEGIKIDYTSNNIE